MPAGSGIEETSYIEGILQRCLRSRTAIHTLNDAQSPAGAGTACVVQWRDTAASAGQQGHESGEQCVFSSGNERSLDSRYAKHQPNEHTIAGRCHRNTISAKIGTQTHGAQDVTGCNGIHRPEYFQL